MKSIISVLFFMCCAQASAMADMGVVLGLRSDSATSTSSATSISGKTNYMAGAIGLIDITDSFLIRTGFIYTVRGYSSQVTGGTAADVTLSYLDLPIGMLWKFSDYGGVFAGGNIGFNVSSQCPGSCSNVSSMPTGYQFGTQFKFSPQMGAALYYEAMSGLVSGLDSPKSVVAQFLYTFN